MSRSLRAGVLLSGTGRTLENLLGLIDEESLDLEIAAVASNRPGVKGLDIATKHRLPAAVFPRSQFESRAQRDASMLGWMRGHGPELLLLAGYLALLDMSDMDDLPVLNIHPALLPRYGGKGYYGDRVHAAVLAAGEQESGATVHLVNPRYDEGALLAQVRVAVEKDDDAHSLAHRVFNAECRLYPQVLQWIADGELALRGGAAFDSNGAPWQLRTIEAPSCR